LRSDIRKALGELDALLAGNRVALRALLVECDHAHAAASEPARHARAHSAQPDDADFHECLRSLAFYNRRTRSNSNETSAYVGLRACLLRVGRGAISR
jgi:hypothetical protein